MATRKRTSSLKKVSDITQNFLSIEEIESKQQSIIHVAYIEEFGGHVNYHAVPAGIALAFYEDGISAQEQLRRMAVFLEKSICNSDGSVFITAERVLEKFTAETINAIVTGMAMERKKDRDSKNA